MILYLFPDLFPASFRGHAAGRTKSSGETV